jgi:type I restriction enzyme S subunit
MAGNGWTLKSIDELKAPINGAIAIGPFGSRMRSDCYVPSGVQVIRGTNISDTRTLVGEMVCIMPELADQLGNAIVHADDLVFPHRGSIGLVGIVPRNNVERYALSSSLMKLTCDLKQVEPLFLFYFFRSKDGQHELLKNASTVGTPGIGQPLSSLRSIKVPLPPLAEQKAIASVLGALDDKIELNRRMNATLESMARALFQSWFVDFDPVRAKLDGRQPIGMDQATAALFPEHLEDSPLGHIPKGWKACPLGELIEVVKGRSYRSEELAESTTALVTLKSFLRGGGYREDGLKPFTGQYKPNQRVYPGDLIVAFTDVTQAADVIGKPALIRTDNRFDKLIASLDVGIVRPKSKHVSIPFLYCLFLTAEFQVHTYSHATGTTVLHLGSTAMPSFISVVPPVEISQKFAVRAEPIFRLIDENAKQSRTLATLRDTLLPKLLSGELSVASLESKLKAVT